jgi:hypothetical protein
MSSSSLPNAFSAGATSPASSSPAKARRGDVRPKRRRSRAQHVSLAPVTAADRYVVPVERRVDDPWPDPDRANPLGPPPQVKVAVNRRVDLLEEELSNKRIGEAEYRAGRLAQAAFEAAQGRVGGSSWSQGDRVDQWQAHELAIIRGLQTAEAARAMVARIERAIGAVPARFLRRMLTEGGTFAAEAVERGRDSARGRSQIAERFRFLLETLAEAWGARGASRGELDAVDPWPEEPGDRRSTSRSTDRRVRGTPAARTGPETDVNGFVVPAGKGYRLGDNPPGRWTPPTRRKGLERAAKA